ncbi:hypothetical protein DRW03_05700 [Corallococcus sp. H22C18031201]|nr:hypothetical protein [Citreicoccus inhibens]RJS25962.1 hypothetical protein DRW03_05700 [Corallococcus sp. H22C18031201]
MTASLLAALLLAAAPPPQKAKEFASRQQWDELYLAFATAEPASYEEADRPALAAALLKGCEALLKDDAVLAYSLGERASVFQESAASLRCLARAALKTDQRAAAEEALRKGLEQYAKDGAFGLELGRMLLEDKNPTEAIAALEKVPPKAKEAAEARKLLQKARAQSNDEAAARREVERIEKRLDNGQPTGGSTQPAVGGDSGEVRSTSLSYESGVGKDGMRTRSNRHFVIRYFNNARDFGQRAEYEGKIVEALDEAYSFTQELLGEARESPVDVVLYTRDEFRTHHGAAMARTVAGLYSDDAIRINDAAELTQDTKGTLVHEYVHAAVDEFCGGKDHRLPTWLNEGLAEFVEWRYLGSDGPPRMMRDLLRGALKADALPRLADMSQGALISKGNPTVAYGTSAVAVGELVRQGGTAKVLTLIRAVGAGKSFEEALQTQYGMGVATLDEQVRSALSGR